MAVADQDMADAFARSGLEQRRDMGVIRRPGIQDRDVRLPR